jgi:hypothetical protein
MTYSFFVELCLLCQNVARARLLYHKWAKYVFLEEATECSRLSSNEYY